jgi:hypothetical protein
MRGFDDVFRLGHFRSRPAADQQELICLERCFPSPLDPLPYVCDTPRQLNSLLTFLIASLANCRDSRTTT